MFCSKCGEKNPDDGKFCSKCGEALVATKAPKAPAAAPAPAPRAAAGERTSGLAIAALVMGIAAFVVFGPLAVLAIIFGAIGISQANKDPNLKGKGMAVAGLVLGIIAVAGWVIVMIVWSSFFWWFI
ncbi:hypothetical protein ES703_29303 [subsurface metagenome]